MQVWLASRKGKGRRWFGSRNEAFRWAAPGVDTYVPPGKHFHTRRNRRVEDDWWVVKAPKADVLRVLNESEEGR